MNTSQLQQDLLSKSNQKSMPISFSKTPTSKINESHYQTRATTPNNNQNNYLNDHNYSSLGHTMSPHNLRDNKSIGQNQMKSFGQLIDESNDRLYIHKQRRYNSQEGSRFKLDPLQTSNDSQQNFTIENRNFNDYPQYQQNYQQNKTQQQLILQPIYITVPYPIFQNPYIQNNNQPHQYNQISSPKRVFVNSSQSDYQQINNEKQQKNYPIAERTYDFQQSNKPQEQNKNVLQYQNLEFTQPQILDQNNSQIQQLYTQNSKVQSQQMTISNGRQNDNLEESLLKAQLESLKQDLLNSFDLIKQEVKLYEKDISSQLKNLTEFTSQEKKHKKSIQNEIQSLSKDYDNIKFKNLDLDIKLSKIHAKLKEKEKQQGALDDLRRSLLQSEKGGGIHSFTQDQQVQIDIQNDEKQGQLKNNLQTENQSENLARYHNIENESTMSQSQIKTLQLLQIQSQEQISLKSINQEDVLDKVYQTLHSRDYQLQQEAFDKYEREKHFKSNLFSSPSIKIKSGTVKDLESNSNEKFVPMQTLNQRFQDYSVENKNYSSQIGQSINQEAKNRKLQFTKPQNEFTEYSDIDKRNSMRIKMIQNLKYFSKIV
eukprot:403358912